LPGVHDYVGMALRNPISIAIATIEKASSAAEEKFLIDLENFVVPELINIKDIRSQKFCRDSSGEIFDSLTAACQPGTIGY
jgi:hypothetical protein